MRCPVCQNVDLSLSERLGVEIDYCPQCRGIWLDRGELDKIIERSNTYSAPSKSYERESKKDGPYERQHHQGYHKKKESFLSELFDF